MKKVLLLSIIFLGGIIQPIFLKAQVSYGGTPPSFNFPDYRLTPPVYQAVIDFDVKKLIEEDKEYENLGNPLRCAKIIPVNLDVINDGEWFTLPDGTWIWQLEIYAPDALAIMLMYEKFIIPEGGKLFLYNPDYSKVLGSYTEETNTKGVEFATELVGGDRIILEYVAPPTDEMLIPQIEISGVVYGYNNLKVSTNLVQIKNGESESCMININCSEGDEWQTQKRGVARTLTPSGGYYYWCSGSLINNTACDAAPLFLSAYHCFQGVSEQNMNQMTFYFNYEDPNCPRTNKEQPSNTITGSEYLVALPMSGGSDGALLRLSRQIPDSYNVYYNGWDRRNIAATSGVGIHHPAGDVKKISTFSYSAVSDGWPGTPNGAANGFWRLIFTETENGRSVTEGGSSGSPIFNQNKLVVGTLTGGNSSCNYPSGTNYYGKLWYHWDQHQEKMNQYLDPAGTGIETLRGISRPTKVDFYPEEEELYVIRPIHFINNSVNDISWEWTFPGGIPSSSTEQNPPPVVYNSPGTYTATLVINRGVGGETVKGFAFDVVVKENLCPMEKTIGSSTEKAQFPLGSENRQIFSSSIYKSSELNLDTRCNINKISWNTENNSSTQRKVYIYLKETNDNIFTNATKWAEEVEGATLVYESPSEWTNNSGWVTFDLIKPYRYSGNKNLKVIVHTLAAAGQEYINSNCFHSIVVNSHIQWISDSQTIPGTTGDINSRRPNIRFNFDIPCGLEAPVAGFTMNNSTAESIQVYRDDIVTFKDASTGPVVNWNWTFEGGDPETSLIPNPKILFHNKGTFDVNMYVDNTLGNNSKSKTVIVQTKKPESNFMSQSEIGFTIYPEHGQLFSNLGGEVILTDKTKNYNDSRTWQLHGLNSVPYKDPVINAIYPAKDEVAYYDVTLQASNEAGIDTKRKNNFIQTGGSRKIWNIPFGDSGKNYFLSSEGNYLTGVNNDYSGIAEKFTTNYSGKIHKVHLRVKAMEGNVANSTYYVLIYQDEYGKPGKEPIAVKTFKGSDINEIGYMTFEYDNPVNVTGTFYIAVSGLAHAPAKIAVASSNETNECTVLGYLRTGSWELLSNIYDKDWKVSLNIIVHYTFNGYDIDNDFDIDDDSNIDIKIFNSFVIYPNPINDSFEIKGNEQINSIYIYDIQGRMIYFQKDINKKQVNISSEWVKGIYLLTIKTNNNIYSYKLIKN